MRGPELVRGLDDLIVEPPIFPVELIDGPSRHTGLLQRAHLRRVRTAQLLGQGVASGRELRQRQLIETIELLVQFHGAAWRMVSSTAEPSSSILRAPMP